jgi:DNA-binding NtrC family response regulator
MKKTILHVDDDADIRNAVETILTNEGYDVKAISNLKSFEKCVDEINPDLIILDVMMEKVDSGLVAYNELKQRYPRVPTILLTSLGEMIRQWFDDKNEMVWILEKPVLPDRLIAMVGARLYSPPLTDPKSVA